MGMDEAGAAVAIVLTVVIGVDGAAILIIVHVVVMNMDVVEMMVDFAEVALAEMMEKTLGVNNSIE